MIGWPRSWLARLSPPHRRLVLVGLALVALGVAVVALTPMRGFVRGGHPPSAQAPTIAYTPGGRERPPAVSAAQLARARLVVRRFLAGYLRFVYGRAGWASVPAVAAALRRQLMRTRVLGTPVERRRHPRTVSLTVAAVAPGSVLATALIDDGGIANYSLRLTVKRTSQGWLVSRVDEG